MNSDNPILNSPYEKPEYHYTTDNDGSLNYNEVRTGHWIFTPDINAISTRQRPQGSMFEVNDYAAEYSRQLKNMVRTEVGKWRNDNYFNTTRLTKELLTFWFNKVGHHAIYKL